jgi:dipeptidyl aminopeptidase/acylaminoacyl peptidase
LMTTKMIPGPNVKAVVEFFGPVALVGGIGGNLQNLPPIQIHHGEMDHIVPIQESEDLIAELKSAAKKGIDYEFFSYPGKDHGFNVIPSTDTILSMDRTVEFFDKRIR